ncbi:MAG: ABC transporter ATP-binding protein [Chloroflexota bacterium]|nr:ABC transporter ATP-binding protein [Chloroflexota bacterium]MDE2941097.1 ABC transporter ATP-binding protein [Chloroflexota bacterium]MDE3267377.1 ABC transporter ATP-binding protein [Chloroflexota bacterium]
MTGGSERKLVDAVPTPKIELDGVAQDFSLHGNTLPVLRGVDLRVHDGEFVSIIGPSGCGKSTLLNLIAGLEEPSLGRILVDGRQVSRRLGTVGYMHQKDLLLPWRSVLDNAVLGPELMGKQRSQARTSALALMEPFGLEGFERSYPAQLSGGMRQRVAFLRTVLADQEVILLDEPFGALDALTRVGMQEWLLGLWESWSKTVVLVTHDVEEAVLLSDRVYVFTPRPGTVKAAFAIDLPRPRRYEMVTDAAFVEIKARALAALREDEAPAGAGGAATSAVLRTEVSQ